MEEQSKPIIRIEDLPQPLAPGGMTTVVGGRSGPAFILSGAEGGGDGSLTAGDDWESPVV